jgi:hypothetical protein
VCEFLPEPNNNGNMSRYRKTAFEEREALKIHMASRPQADRKQPVATNAKSGETKKGGLSIEELID